MILYRYTTAGSHIGWVDVPEDEVVAYLSMPGYTDITPPSFIPPNHGATMGPEGWTTAIDNRGRAWIGPIGEVFVATEVGHIGPPGWVELGFSRMGG